MPNAFSNASTVSLTVTFAPLLNPNNAPIPLSLKRSAAPTPLLNALCICSEALAKSNPDTAATLPVIFNILLRSSASLATTANDPLPFAISCSENGTLLANLVKF